ncbi:hypothetical protein [Tenacibaculum agarivorans]|uniref:hypothetical protein n=1 Tax=Tenacibaculum agarivorans TaxID=1908389 RepID=UPI00094BA334|nr:hypothetical protein [Tenacibaculum agarivorans]
MSKSSFHKVFNVAVLHDYYSDNICKGLVYTPTIETEEIIYAYNFKINITTKGFELYTYSNTTIPSLLNYINRVTGAESFNFNVTTSNTHFYQFTNLPINEIGITYFNSAEVEKTTKTEKIILKPHFIRTRSTEFLFKLSVGFKELIGLYELKKEGNYEIQFQSRLTKWKYFIINSTKRSLGVLTISDTSGIQFEGPEKVLLQNKQEAQLFSVSNTLLPFSERPLYKFNLESTTQKNGMDRTKVIFKGLPNANPNVLGINASSSPPIVESFMYVYV